MKIAPRSMLVLLLAAGIAACSGSDGPTTGPLTVRVIDTPIDPALIDRVCIVFTGITAHYSGNDDVYLAYEPRPTQISAETHCTEDWMGGDDIPPVRLDALSGALTVALVDSLQVPIGRITWIRLHFEPGSYLVDSVGRQDLDCPSCELTDNNQRRGFKLNRNFEVTAAGLGLLVDIDLRKSLHESASGYVLRPTARVEADDTIGTIAGDVDAALIDTLGGTAYTGGDTDTGCAVYVFPDDGSEPGDFYDPGSNVISTATVRYNGEPLPFSYSYAAGGIPGGDNGTAESYRVALTCDADDPLLNDDAGVVEFTPAQVVDVIGGQTAEASFSP